MYLKSSLHIPKLFLEVRGEVLDLQEYAYGILASSGTIDQFSLGEPWGRCSGLGGTGRLKLWRLLEIVAEPASVHWCLRYPVRP